MPGKRPLSVRLAMPEFFAPWPLCAVALLALNDRLLKATFHNDITGKLSDIAVCFFMPLLLSAILGLVALGAHRFRIAAGAAVTAVVYTLLEV
jgi:hypothetical protein